MIKNPPLLEALAVSIVSMQVGAVARQTALSQKEARAIGVDAYLYIYPLVTMDITRRQRYVIHFAKDELPTVNAYAGEQLRCR